MLWIVAGNEISCDGGKAIAALLLQNSHLGHLDLSSESQMHQHYNTTFILTSPPPLQGNNLNAKGSAALMAALSKNKGLRTLILEGKSHHDPFVRFTKLPLNFQLTKCLP